MHSNAPNTEPLRASYELITRSTAQNTPFNSAVLVFKFQCFLISRMQYKNKAIKSTDFADLGCCKYLAAVQSLYVDTQSERVVVKYHSYIASSSLPGMRAEPFFGLNAILKSWACGLVFIKLP